MSGSKQTTETKQSSQPWAPVRPGLENIITQAGVIGGNTANFQPTYSGTTMRGIDRLEALGQQPGVAQNYLSNIVNRSGQGFDTGVNQLQATAGGGMLGGNPYLDQMLGNNADDIAARVNRQFSGAGRYGSAAHTGELTRNIGNMTTQARVGNWTNERNNQLNAANQLYGGGFQGAGMSGQLDAANAQQAQMLLGAGQMRDQMAASERLAPMQALEWEKNMIAPIGAMGTESAGTQTTHTPANPMGMLLGGAMMAGGAMTGNPKMALTGAGQLGKSSYGGGFGGGGGFFNSFG